MYDSDTNAPQPTDHKRRITTRNPKLDALLGSDIDDESDGENEDTIGSSKRGGDPTRPWLQGFHNYLNMREHLGDTTIVQWWGIHSARYPVWGSLARDFLPIMASSVSSERAFSSAGITITKRRNRLKADVVEALQFLKCSTRSSVLVRDSEDPLLAPEVHDKQDSGDDDGETEDEWDGSINE